MRNFELRLTFGGMKIFFSKKNEIHKNNFLKKNVPYSQEWVGEKKLRNFELRRREISSSDVTPEARVFHAGCFFQERGGGWALGTTPSVLLFFLFSQCLLLELKNSIHSRIITQMEVSSGRATIWRMRSKLRKSFRHLLPRWRTWLLTRPLRREAATISRAKTMLSALSSRNLVFLRRLMGHRVLNMARLRGL